MAERPVAGDDLVLANWKAVLEQMPGGVVLARAPDGELLYRNDAAVRVLDGEGQAEGGAAAVVEHTLARCIREGARLDGDEIEFHHANGSLGVICVNAAPILAGGGATIGAVMSFTDVTDRRRAEADRRFLAEASALLASSLDYAITLRNVARLAVPTLADWCTVDVVRENGAVERLAVEHVDPVHGEVARQLDRIFPPGARAHPGVHRVLRNGRPEVVPQITDAMLRGLARDEEGLALLRGLRLRSAMIVPLTARGRSLGHITLVSSESGRTYGPHDRALAEELALRAGLAIDNARLYHESQAANRAKADFLSVISHELRTPLTAVIGYAELLALGIPEPITERQGEQVERIEIAARHLLQLIEEILTITNLEAGTISVRRRPTPLAELLRRAEAITRPMALEKGLELHVDAVPDAIVLNTDPDKLLQVILNLLSNAVKFTDTGSVCLRAVRHARAVEISVRDTGVGIPLPEQAQIFDSFWQAEQPVTRRAGGTGLGLTISQRLLAMLDGEITVSSEPGAGSVFVARIPVEGD